MSIFEATQHDLHLIAPLVVGFRTELAELRQAQPTADFQKGLEELGEYV